MKVLVCGSRNWVEESIIKYALRKLLYDNEPEEIEVIHGDCRGADRLAGKIAKELGMRVTKFPANWKEHGRAAGPIRNQQMLDEDPDIVIGFHEHVFDSKGTIDMLIKSTKKGVKIILYTESEQLTDFSIQEFPSNPGENNE